MKGVIKMTKIEKLLAKRGIDLAKLLKDDEKYAVTNMPLAAKEIFKAVSAKRHIHVVADYDCDGVMSGCILYLILKEMGADFTIRFPKKMSEGYGISEKILTEIPDNSLVITVDNGIAAIETIDSAKSRGMTVIILDHHQIRGDNLLPAADVLVNPHIFKQEGEFEDYCGAGLAYMLAKELNMPKNVLLQANILAAIATVQDVVSLTRANRCIVKFGLKLLNKKAADLPGLYSLCAALKLVPTTDVYAAINEEDLAFQIGPCINAMGRMLDNGAELSFEYLMHYDVHGEDGIAEIVKWNAERKRLTTLQQNVLDIEAAKVLTPKTTCLVLYVSDLHEGIMGINAARTVEKYGMPAIIFAKSENGLLKGSARSTDDINIKECLDSVADLICQYGGHAGAAGLSIEERNLEAFTKALNKRIPKSTGKTTTWFYDLEVIPSEVPDILNDIKKYGPFGEGFPAPIVKVNGFNLCKNFGKYYRNIGDNGVSFNGDGLEAVSFSLRDKYIKIGTPLELNIVGEVGFSRYSKKPQIMIKDFQQIITNRTGGFLI